MVRKKVILALLASAMMFTALAPHTIATETSYVNGSVVPLYENDCDLTSILAIVGTKATCRSTAAAASTYWFSFSVSGIGDCEYSGAIKETDNTSCSIMVDGGSSPSYPIYLATSSTNKGQGTINSSTVTVSSNATRKYSASYLSSKTPHYGDPIYLKGWTGYYSTSLEGTWQP